MEESKWRILVVDDEPDARLVIRTALESKYEVVEANDGLDALEKLERYEPDFVLMDVMMPLMNGFDACAQIRKTPRFKEIPVMFLSALGSKEEIKKGYSHGANLYLTKPFDPPRLVRNVDLFFEQSPPPPRRRRYSFDELKKAEKEKREPVAPGAAEFMKTSKKKTEKKEPQAEASPPAKPAPETQQQEAPQSALPRVMVVDDSPENIDLIRVSLEGVVEVVWASDGIQAIERLVKYQPDMLIIDIMLPKMNGYQLTQSLRANRAFARIPIMICSAKGANRDVNFAKRLGANEYLVKPFSPADLYSKVKELQKLPDFHIRPKTYSIDQIREMESSSTEKDVFTVDEEAREKGGKRSGKGDEDLESFLKQEGKKEALERSAPPQEEKKKRRRFFGMGGKS